ARREQTSEVYRPNQEPGQAAVRSKQTSDSLQTGDDVARGVPGALSNQPPAAAQAPIVNPPPPPAQPGQAAPNAAQAVATPAATALPTSNRSDATINYEVDRTISHVKQPVGQLKRLSVAVVVNYLPDDQGEPKPLPPEELTKLTNLVREAMGYSEARGDSLNLVNSQFNDQPVQPPFYRDAELIDLVKTVLAWVLGLALAIWLYRRFAPMVSNYLNPPVDPEEAEARRLEAQREAQAAARAKEVDRYEDNLQRARDMATKDPRAVAMVMRAWMTKDEK